MILCVYVAMQGYFMVNCKKCLSEKLAKDGFVRGKRCYICKECNCHFVEGDERTDDKIVAKKSNVYTFLCFR